MSFVARLLSFILCFELIVGGYGPSLISSSTALAADCPAGTQMDTTLNRCLTSNQVASVQMAVASCSSGTNEEKQKCYQNNAQNALNSQVNAGATKNNNTNLGSKSPLLRVGSGAAIAVPLFLLTRNLFKKKSERMVCKPASLMLMYAGAGVLLGGEVITYITHKKKLKDMKSRWEDIAVPKSEASADSKRAQQTEAQSQAFEFLAQNEDSIAKTANTKFIYYASAAGLFAAGAVMAVVEKVKLTRAIAAEKVALAKGDAAAAAAAKTEIDRIECKVTKGQASEKAKEAKACEEAGGTSKDGICTTAAQKTEAEEKAEAKRQAEAAKAEQDKIDKMTPAEKQAYEDAKNAKLNAANEKLTQANTNKTNADQKLDEASDKLATLTDKDGKKLPGVKESDYQNALDAKNDAQSVRNNAAAEQKNAKTNLKNVQNGISGNKPAGQNAGGNAGGSSEKKEAGGLAGKVLTGGLNQLGSIIGGGNSSGNQPLGTTANGAASGKPENSDKVKSDKDLCIDSKGTYGTKGCYCPNDNYDPTGKFCKSTSINDLRNFKLKRTAQYNLDNSSNAYELLELEKELENIEIENYSKLTNYDDIDVAQFKEFSFAGFTNKMITNLNPISNAHSDPPCGFDGQPACDLDPVTVTAERTGHKSFEKAETVKVDRPNLEPKANTAAISDEIVAKMKASVSNIGKAASTAVADGDSRDKIDKAIGNPITRAAINGVFGTWIGIMSADFKEQATISKKRAEVLRNMRDEFASYEGITTCNDADRNASSKPDCYCYTAEGKRNSARATSAICQKIWGTYNGAGSGDYLADNSKVCIDVNGNVDAACSCRSQKGADGKNTCMKAGASSFNLSGLSTGSFKMLSAGTSTANDLVNGVLGAGQIDGAAAASNAMRIRKAADDMLKSSDPAAALQVKKLSDNIASSAIQNSAGLSMGGGDSGSSMANMTPAQAVKSLDEELKKETTQDITTAGSSESVGGGNSAPEQLEFGMTQEDLAIQEDQIAEVMNKDLDMDTADITKGSDTNIFDVLSNRYQRSGMRRLFDVDGKTKAEKPAESDISQ